MVPSQHLVAGSRKYLLDHILDKNFYRAVLCLLWFWTTLAEGIAKQTCRVSAFKFEQNLAKDNQFMTYKLDVARRIYLLSHSAMACQWGTKNFCCSTGIRCKNILAGKAIFPFDLTQDHSTEDVQVSRHQTTSLESTFSTALLESVELLDFFEQLEVFRIDKERKLTNVP